MISALKSALIAASVILVGAQTSVLADESAPKNIVETLKSACLILLWAADPFLRAFPKDGFEERVKTGIAGVKKLLG